MKKVFNFIFIISLTLSIHSLQSQVMTPTSQGDWTAASAIKDISNAILLNQQPTNGGYILRADDLIKISVFQEDDLTLETRIPKAGSIDMPLIGATKVLGLSVNQVTADVRSKLGKDYLVNPQVTLIILEFSKEWVTVLGEVQRPGHVEIPPEGALNLLDAISLAGGYTQIANPKNVLVRRAVKENDMIFKVNALLILKDPETKVFQLQPGDIITVGQSFF